MTRKINVQLFANLLNNLQRNSSQRQLMHSLGLSLSMRSREAVDAKRFASKVVAQLARLYQYSRCLIVPWPGLLAKTALAHGRIGHVWQTADESKA